MSFKHLIELQDLLDDPAVDGERVAAYLRANGASNVEVQTLSGQKDVFRIMQGSLPMILSILHTMNTLKTVFRG